MGRIPSFACAFVVLSIASLSCASCSSTDEEGGPPNEPDDGGPVCALCGDGAPNDSGAPGENDSGAPPEDGGGSGCATCGNVCEESLTDFGADHVEGDLSYVDSPPASGTHNGCWATYGFHEEVVRPENWVHNLEHGAVVLLYNCPDGCDTEVENLRAFTESHPRTLVTEYSAMPPGFAAVAWTVRLVTPCLDLDAFEAFYARHFAHGLENVSGGPPSGC